MFRGNITLTIATVILAAGLGTRMKSSLPKIMHPVGGKPMVVRAVQTAEKIQAARRVLVIGHGAQSVQEVVGTRAEYVLQGELLGTGHAVLQAAPVLRGATQTVLVYYADMPLLRAETMTRILALHANGKAPITMLTVNVPDPRGFGRIIRDAVGNITAIVEEKECTPEQLAIRELNASVYAFQADWLWQNLPDIQPKSKGEYYLTDLVEIAARQGLPVQGLQAEDLDEMIGVNTRLHLSEAEASLRRRVNTYWMVEGVTMIDPSHTYISEDSVIGRDTIIYPNTHIQGRSVIGTNCQIGPNTVIFDSQAGNGCHINSSVVEEAVLEANVHVGPFAHLRKGAYLEEGVHMGNFGEVKNSRLGRQTRMGHFSYIGDAQIGPDVNIGAGTITANFDGKDKHKTIIGESAFIGSDTILVAPVTIGDAGRTGAGSVVTKDVEPGQTVIGVPAKPYLPKAQEAK
jgi:bifunctional UDP-N-acetylglucosamine pyrophosphorylase / glucosamine-1-phosphate N-acetyltransferase